MFRSFDREFEKSFRRSFISGIIMNLIVLGFIIAMFVGWFMNIVAFAGSDFEKPYKSEVIRGIGIPVAPMGGVIGFMTIGDEE